LATDVAGNLKSYRNRVEVALERWLREVTSDAPVVLREAMHYGLMAPGKRMRPILAMLACEAVGGPADSALPAGVAVEMVHAYSLIHDDLPAMDDDDLRRGRPTCHIRFDEATAILAGDALLTSAFEVLAKGYPPRTAAVAILELSRGAGALGMVGGQMLDLAAEGRIAGQVVPETLEGLEQIHRMKTGALFAASLRLGQIAAEGETGIDPTHRAALDTFADCFGLAFQITDDLLDVESTAEQTGKRVGKDASRGKLTYPGLLGVDESRRRANDLIERGATALRPFGPKGTALAELARYLTDRNH
jgi:geranylgeranyl diphosphate synthase, type II